jgi:hypothetical protein
MNVRRASALLAAVVATGIGLSACSNSASPSANSGSTPGASSAGSPTAASAPASPAASSAAGSPTSTATAESTAAAQPASTPSLAPAPSKAPPTEAAGSGTSFTVPAIAGENVADGSGTYVKESADVVQVHVCVTQTGSAFAVGIEAVVYNSAGASKDVGAVVLTGSGHTSCSTLAFLGYTAHLKVHTFIGAGGNITKTSPVVSVY